LVDLAGS